MINKQHVIVPGDGESWNYAESCSLIELTKEGAEVIESQDFDNWGDFCDLDEDRGYSLIKEYKNISRLLAPPPPEKKPPETVPPRPESPVPGQKLNNGAMVLLCKTLPFREGSGLAPACIVLCQYGHELVTWHFNEQTQSCNWGHYFDANEAQDAALDFAQRG